jgi:hypothetical protein
MSGSGSEAVRMMDCEHAAASMASSPRGKRTGTSGRFAEAQAC